MDWRDQGIVLGISRYGEYDAVADMLTREHGRHRGLVRGGDSRRMRGILQPGNELTVNWRARLESHLGHFTIEPFRARAAAVMGSPQALNILSAATALAALALPEREGHRAVFEGLIALLDALEGDVDDEDGQAAQLLARWELGLLEDLGFGLDLSVCVATGATEELIYVSPRSGGAVCAAAGAPYAAKLLRLPGFLGGAEVGRNAAQEALDGLALTGFFLAKHVLTPHGRELPAARQRLIARLQAKMTGLTQIL